MSSVETIAADNVGDEIGDIAEEMIRLRIMHTLLIYPKLSPSMLQIGIGTGFPPALWHPVLEKLIAEGKVERIQVQATNPVSKREQTYTILREPSVQAQPAVTPIVEQTDKTN